MNALFESYHVATSPFGMPYPTVPQVAPIDVAKSLAKRGFNPEEAHLLNAMTNNEKKRDYLSKNLETTINHVFEDSVVSFTNHYQLNKQNEVVSYPDGTLLNIDPDERGGLNKFGIESAVAGALENPNQLVLLYSPPGPVVFDNNPNNKFREIKPYTDGQLYMMYSDGEKVNNVAVSVSEEGELWVSQLMPYVYQQALSQPTDIERVAYFIQNPVLTGKSIDEFLNQRWNESNKAIYTNKDNIRYSLPQTLSLIRQSLAGMMPKSRIVADIIEGIDFDHFTMQDIDSIYGALAQHYMIDRGLTSLTMGGSCGGDVVKLDIFSNGMDNLSSSFRAITQGKNIPEFVKPSDEKEKITFELKPGHTCQKCGVDGGERKLGNCDICTACQEKYDKGEFK